MITHPAAAAACKAGSWAQQWQCKWNAGWNDHTSAAYRAGYGFGHNIVPVLILAAFVLLIAKAARRRKGAGRKVEPAAKAWKRAKVPAQR